MPTHDADHLAATIASLLDAPRVLAELRQQVAELASAVRAIEAALPPMLVDCETAAEALGCSPVTVRRWARLGAVPARKMGRSYRIDLTKLRGIDAAEIARLAREARALR